MRTRSPADAPGVAAGSGTLLAPLPLALTTTVSLAVALAVALATGTLTVASLLTPGGLGPAAPLIVEDFGAEAVDPGLTGYDGQQVYAVARELPDLRGAAAWLDSPAYRLLRVVPPAIASLAPPGAPTALALLALNVFAVGLAVWAAARLLARHGSAPAAAIPAVAVLLLGVATTTVEPVAWAFALVGLERGTANRHGTAIVAFTVAALSRETAAVAAAAAGAGLLLRGIRPSRAAAYVLPGLAVVAWFAILSTVVAGSLPRRVDPFGFLELRSMGEIAVAAGVATLGILGTALWRDVPAIALCAATFTSWLAFYTVDILDPIALLRVNGLAIILGILGVARSVSRRGMAATGP